MICGAKELCESLAKETTNNRIPLMYDNPCWVLCIFIEYAGDLLGRWRYFSLFVVHSYSNGSLCWPQKIHEGVGGGGGCTCGKSILSFLTL